MSAHPILSSRQFDAHVLLDALGGRTVSVCLPARNEEATVGAVVGTMVRALVEEVPLVDEVLVVDDRSGDATAAVAAAAGARVVAADDVHPEWGPGTGKGEALWKSLAASTGDLVVWCDADVVGFDPSFVTGLLGPLVLDPSIGFVKARYERPLHGNPGEGGRVTELLARPLVALLFPHLAHVEQPLAGECAGRREVLERQRFVQGYGVDLALLVDVAEDIGVDALAQVDLGRRVHRNRPLGELSGHSLAILHAVLQRVDPTIELVEPAPPVEVGERPPLRAMAGYRRAGSPSSVNAALASRRS